MEPGQTEHGRVALAFASALAKGDFQAACQMLTARLRRQYGPADLAKRYGGMVELYHAGFQPAKRIQVTTTMEDWPTKKRGDIGWAYVSITGDFARGSWCEAVAVVVTKERDQLRVREVEWGRP
jgi:hypothetical protein